MKEAEDQNEKEKTKNAIVWKWFLEVGRKLF